MKRNLAVFLALALFLSLSICGSCQESSDNAAEYIYEENLPFGTVPWTLTLAEDGTYSLSVTKPTGATCVYTGSYELQDGAVVTGAPAEDTSDIEAGFFNDDYSCVWLLSEDGTMKPEKEGEAGAMDGMMPGRMDGGGMMSGMMGGSSENADYAAVAYASDSASQVMDIYLPENAADVSPVIVVVHGGGFKFGDQTMPIIQPVIEAGTANGYVVASVDYRKSGEAVFPAALSDVKAAVRYLKANAAVYGIDPERIVVWGESAGAYLSLMTALTPDVETLNGTVGDNSDQSSQVAALVDFYGPVEFYTMDEEYEAMGISGTSYSSDASFESAFLGQAIGLDKETAYTTWWGTYTDQLPEDFELYAWIQAGDADTSVPCTQSQNFAEKLEEVIGSENVRFSLIEGAEHEDDLFYTEDNLAQIFAFLAEVLA